MLSHPVPSAASVETDALALLNGVPLTAVHLAAALAALGMLPIDQRDDSRAQALVLQAYARDAGFEDDTVAAAALHARAAALAKWTAGYDPQRQSDAEAVLDAAARYPLSDLARGVGFEPGGFQELILFIEELPW